MTTTTTDRKALQGTVITADAVELGDIVRLAIEGEARQPFNCCTVIRIERDTPAGTVITLFRPYVHTSDFSYTSGVIPYIGFEQFTVWATSRVTLIQAAQPVR